MGRNSLRRFAFSRMQVALRSSVALALIALISGFAYSDDPSPASAGFCSLVPIAALRDASVSFFVATARSDTVAAGAGSVRPSPFGGHWGPANNRAIYGQVVTIHELGGAAARVAESSFVRRAAREAVLVPWDYDPACQPVPWARSARWVIDARPGFYRARLRPPAEWADGRPTYDVYHADIEPYPHGLFFQRGYRHTDSAQMAAALTATEYFGLYAALPDAATTRCDPQRASRQLTDWEAAHPDQAGRFPATRILKQARRSIPYQSNVPSAPSARRC
jgi:hypothetical protein